MASQCSALNTYKNFLDYVKLMRNITSDELTVPSMGLCRVEICSVLYGAGNTDISGIGVVAVYIIHLLLGVLLASAVIIADTAKAQPRWTSVVQRGYSSYFDVAIVLTFSVQVAAVVLLIKKTYGLGAIDLGDLTMEVTWAAALLTFLPAQMIYLITPRTTDSDSISEDRTLDRFWISMSWLLFFSTFVTRMVSYYSTGQVGNSSTAVISAQEADNIAVLCFGRKSFLSESESMAIRILATGGSIFVSISTISMLADTVGQRREHSWSIAFRKTSAFEILQKPVSRLLLVFSVLLWAVPQVWTIFRFRQLQTQLARSMDTTYVDNEWTFGQIMALVVFLPVFVQMAYASFQHAAGTSENDAESQQATATSRSATPRKDA